MRVLMLRSIQVGLLLGLWVFQAASAQSPPASASCGSVATTAEVDQRLDEVRRLRAAGRFDDARNKVMPLLRQYPDTFRVLYVGGLVSVDQQNWGEAERQLKAAIDRLTACAGTQGFKTDYSVYNTLGWVQMEQGHLATAQISFQAALSHAQDLTPASVTRAQSNLGFLYFTTGAFEKAGPLLQAAADKGNANATKLLPQLKQAQSIYQAQSAKSSTGGGALLRRGAHSRVNGGPGQRDPKRADPPRRGAVRRAISQGPRVPAESRLSVYVTAQ